VGEKASAPQSAGETSAISRSEPRTKEQSYFRSPTEKQQKSINHFVYLKKRIITKNLIARRNRAARLAAAPAGLS